MLPNIYCLHVVIRVWNWKLCYGCKLRYSSEKKSWFARENSQPHLDSLNFFQMVWKAAPKFKTISTPLHILVKIIQTGDHHGGHTHLSHIFSSLWTVVGFVAYSLFHKTLGGKPLGNQAWSDCWPINRLQCWKCLLSHSTTFIQKLGRTMPSQMNRSCEIEEYLATCSTNSFSHSIIKNG
jgi:hypothetical protein